MRRAVQGSRVRERAGVAGEEKIALDIARVGDGFAKRRGVAEDRSEHAFDRAGVADGDALGAGAVDAGALGVDEAVVDDIVGAALERERVARGRVALDGGVDPDGDIGGSRSGPRERDEARDRAGVAEMRASVVHGPVDRPRIVEGRRRVVDGDRAFDVAGTVESARRAQRHGPEDLPGILEPARCAQGDGALHLAGIRELRAGAAQEHPAVDGPGIVEFAVGARQGHVAANVALVGDVL